MRTDIDKLITEVEKFLKEDTNDTGFNDWLMALKKYNEAAKTTKYDTELDKLFTGSNSTSRFIFRSSVSNKSKSMYDKDCKDFGKDKVDALVQKVLTIIK